tara:strand:+ start:65 stop:2353 length:2289 start_codon:yes stop_codon:yes gene_type:complete
MTSKNIIEFLDENNINWMPIHLELKQTKTSGKIRKYIRPYKENSQMPSYTELSDNNIVNERQKLASNYDFIWIDTRIINQVDVDGDEDPKLDTPYFESVTKKTPHYFVKGFFGFSKKRSPTKWKDVELLSGQGSYCNKNICVYNAEKQIINYCGRVNEILKSDEVSEKRVNNTLNQNISDLLNTVFQIQGNWKSNYYASSRSVILIPANDKTCLINKNKVHSCVQSFVCIGKTSCNVKCHSCGERKIDIKKNQTSWKSIRQYFDLASSESENISFDVLQDYLDDYCAEEDLMKKDGYIMKRSSECRIEYEKVLKFGPFLDDLFREAEAPLKKFYKKPGTKRNLEDYLIHIDTDIRTLKRDSNIVSFKNGFLKLKDFTFHEYDDSCNYTFIAKKYIPLDFEVEWLNLSWEQIDCPIFDKIIQDQPQIVSDPMVLLAFYGLLGSLHYPVGYDSIKVVPYLVGTSGTGKSTIVNIYLNTFSQECVGTINYKEKTFGKSAFLDHDVIIDSDTPANMIDCFGKTDFQKAVSGETIAIPIKNQKQEEQHKVTQRMLFCSQYMQDVQDTGEVIRRIAYFGFEPVENTNSNLENECINQEIHKVLMKTLLARKKLIEIFKNKPFHEWDIQYFDSRKDDILMENNYIYRMISEHKYFKIRKGKQYPFEEFVVKFNEHFKNQPGRPKKPKTTDVMFTKMGLKVVKDTVCKDCGNKFQINKPCCHKFEKNNKTSNYYIGDLWYEEPCIFENINEEPSKQNTVNTLPYVNDTSI